MKAYLPVLFGSLILASCSNTEATSTFHIEGSVNNDDVAYIQQLLGDSTVVVDTLVLTGNHFSADIPANGKDGIYNVMFPGGTNFRFCASPSDSLKFDIAISPSFLNYTVEGNDYSKNLQHQQALMGNTIQILDSLDEINNLYKDSANFADVRAGLNQVYQNTMIAHRQALLDIVNQDSTALTNIFVIYHQVGNSSVLNPATDLDIYYRIDNGVFSKYPEHPIAKTYHKSILQFKESIERQKLAEQARLSITKGSLAPEISLPDPMGEKKSLSDLRGKIVLIDFWASWCGPCRQNNPHLVQMYQQYKDKGFEIFSVSLDGVPNQKGLPREAWRAAIQQDGLTWPNHVSDLKGWDSDVVLNYGIEGIPFTVLLDRDGYILGTNLRGPALEEQLQIHLGN